MKLHYFNLYGRGEDIRVLLNKAGAEYEDVRIEFKDWPELKKDTEKFEYGQMPVLEKDGKFYAQSGAILRMLAKEYGFMPEDAEDEYRVNALIESLKDFWLKAFPLKDLKEEERKEGFENFVKTTVVPLFTVWEKKITANSSNDFMVGDSFTLIDSGFLNLYANFMRKTGLKEMFEGILANYPNFKAYLETRYEDQKDYFESRPDCPF